MSTLLFALQMIVQKTRWDEQLIHDNLIALYYLAVKKASEQP